MSKINWATITAYLVVLGFIAILFAIPVHAQEHHHPKQDAEIHAKFYRTWMMPDNRTLSCCSERDCHPTEARMVGDHWQAKSITGEWLDVPDIKVETERSNPDGRSHLCELSESKTVLCFSPGSGT